MIPCFTKSRQPSLVGTKEKYNCRYNSRDLTFLVRIGTSLLPKVTSFEVGIRFFVFSVLKMSFKEQEEIRNKIYVTGGGYISFTGI